MAFNKPIDDNDCVKYKIANTDRQSCLVCGHPMRDGQIGLSVTNAHLEQAKAKKTPSGLYLAIKGSRVIDCKSNVPKIPKVNKPPAAA